VVAHSLSVADHNLVVVAIVVANPGLAEAAAFVSPSMPLCDCQGNIAIHRWRRNQEHRVTPKVSIKA